MTRLFATGLVGVALLLAVPAFAADAPKTEAPAAAPQAPPPAAAPKAAAPAADSKEWFPGFMQACKEHGLEEADCTKRYEARKQAIMNICEKEKIAGEDACRDWMKKQMAEVAEQRRALCKENGIEGDEACQNFIQQRQAEAMDAFQAQCKKDNLNEDQCQERYNETVRKWQEENAKFMADCTAKGGKREDCMKQLREKRRAEGASGMSAGKTGNGPAGNAPAGNPPSGDSGKPLKPEKGTALPPPQ
jgi:hypothetical protein